MFPVGDVAMSVIKQSQHSPGGGNTRVTPWQQNREDSAQKRIVFGYVIVLHSRHTDEVWLCDMTSSSPDEVIVVNRLKYIFFCYSTLLILENCMSTGNGQFPLWDVPVGNHGTWDWVYISMNTTPMIIIPAGTSHRGNTTFSAIKWPFWILLFQIAIMGYSAGKLISFFCPEESHNINSCLNQLNSKWALTVWAKRSIDWHNSLWICLACFQQFWGAWAEKLVCL